MAPTGFVLSDEIRNHLGSVSRADFASKLPQIAFALAQNDLFAYALLSDCFDIETSKLLRERLASDFARWYPRLQSTIEARVATLVHWQQDGNKTIAAIRNGDLIDIVKPHARKSAAEYDAFYTAQSQKFAVRQGRAVPDSQPAVEDPSRSMRLPPNINHAIRKPHAVHLMEVLIGLVAMRLPAGSTVRWLDVGCGVGEIANAVDPRRYGATSWDIVGCDFQEGKIAVANASKAQGRTFFCANALDILKESQVRGRAFDIVTMFEFLEHLEDPLGFVEGLKEFRPQFTLAASPLEQRFDQPFNAEPDRVHLWSFARRGFEKIFELSGLSAVYSSEVRVGAYIGGLDFLSLVCGPRDEMATLRESWRA